MKKKISTFVLTLSVVLTLFGFSATAEDQPTINQGAAQGSQSQSAGQMMNMIASGALFAACVAGCPHHCRMELCAMGALAAMQAANQGQAADQSDLTFDASKYGIDNNLNETVKPTADGASTASFSDPKIKEGMDKLKEAGYKVTEAGVTMPDGSFQPASAFNSPSSMLAAGMDPAAAKAAGDVLNKLGSSVDDGARVTAMAVDAGGGGGGGYGGGGDSGMDSGSYSLAKLTNPFANKDNKKLAAGKSLMVSGEPIGVKSDNIFDMVHRAYQKKRQRQLFLEGVFRLPANQSRNGL